MAEYETNPSKISEERSRQPGADRAPLRDQAEKKPGQMTDKQGKSGCGC